MSYLDNMAARQQAEQARLGRVEARARREARYDLRQGSTITPKDADYNRRSDPAKADFWKFYGDELRAQRSKA